MFPSSQASGPITTPKEIIYILPSPQIGEQTEGELTQLYPDSTEQESLQPSPEKKF